MHIFSSDYFELLSFGKNKPWSLIECNVFFLMANHFLLGYIKTCFYSITKWWEREMHHAMIQRVDLFLYAPQYEIMLSAGNIFNPQLLFTMIWFTCKVSFQHNSNNFDTFTVICKRMVIITSMFFLNYIFNPFSSSVSFYSIEFMILWKL